MQQHEGNEDVGVDRRELQRYGVNNGRSRLAKEEAGVGFVQIPLAAADHPDQRDIKQHDDQESSVDFPAASQCAHHDGAPALFSQRSAIGQHAGVAGYKNEDFAGVAEAVVAHSQPAQRIIRNVVDEYEPESQAATGIQPQIAAVCTGLNLRDFIHCLRAIGHERNWPHPPDSPGQGLLADSAATVCVRKLTASMGPVLVYFPAQKSRF